MEAPDGTTATANSFILGILWNELGAPRSISETATRNNKRRNRFRIKQLRIRAKSRVSLILDDLLRFFRGEPTLLFIENSWHPQFPIARADFTPIQNRFQQLGDADGLGFQTAGDEIVDPKLRRRLSTSSSDFPANLGWMCLATTYPLCLPLGLKLTRHALRHFCSAMSNVGSANARSRFCGVLIPSSWQIQKRTNWLL